MAGTFFSRSAPSAGLRWRWLVPLVLIGSLVVAATRELTGSGLVAFHVAAAGWYLYFGLTRVEASRRSPEAARRWSRGPISWSVVGGAFAVAVVCLGFPLKAAFGDVAASTWVFAGFVLGMELPAQAWFRGRFERDA